MKKFIVSVPVDYVDGYLRTGHREMIVEADSELEAKEKIEFLASTKSIQKKIEDEIKKNDKRNTPTKLDRTKDRSEINIF
jgi:hypothetical protein